MTALALRYGLPALLALALVLGIFGLGWKLNGDRVDARWLAEWSKRDAAEANLRADAVQAARTEEQRRFAAGQQVVDDARKQTTVINFGVGQLSVAADGLRLDAAELSKSASSASCNSPAPDRSETTRRAAMVLSDLLGRCSATLEELAPAYDRARNAGLTCERRYDSLTPQ